MSHDQLDLGEPATRSPDPFILARLGLSAAEILAGLPRIRFERYVCADLVQALLADIPALAALRGVDRFTAEEAIKKEFERAIAALGEFNPDDPGDGEDHPCPNEPVVIPFQRAA